MWIWNDSTYRKLKGWEGLYLRRMAGIAKKPRETWETYYVRAIRDARKLYAQTGHAIICTRVLEQIFGPEGPRPENHGELSTPPSSQHTDPPPPGRGRERPGGRGGPEGPPGRGA